MANKKYTDLYLDYTYNDPSHPERIYYQIRSLEFCKKWNSSYFLWTTGGHADYHKPTDTVDKILFELLTEKSKT